jgi:Immunoglobulin I-set domain
MLFYHISLLMLYCFIRLVPPRIDSTNLEMKPMVILGKPITLNCPVQGSPFPNITWLKDGDLLFESERIRYLSNGRQLEITLAQESDTAVYICIATNVAGKATKEFALEVLGKSYKFIQVVKTTCTYLTLFLLY